MGKPEERGPFAAQGNPDDEEDRDAKQRRHGHLSLRAGVPGFTACLAPDRRAPAPRTRPGPARDAVRGVWRGVVAATPAPGASAGEPYGSIAPRASATCALRVRPGGSTRQCQRPLRAARSLSRWPKSPREHDLHGRCQRRSLSSANRLERLPRTFLEQQEAHARCQRPIPAPEFRNRLKLPPTFARIGGDLPTRRNCDTGGLAWFDPQP